MFVAAIEYTDYRVQSFLSSLRQVGSPYPLTRRRVLPPRETHSLAGEGVGGPISDEGTDTLIFYVYYNPIRLLVLLAPPKEQKYKIFLRILIRREFMNSERGKLIRRNFFFSKSVFEVNHSIYAAFYIKSS
jgi:hypothetical protein